MVQEAVRVAMKLAACNSHSFLDSLASVTSARKTTAVASLTCKVLWLCTRKKNVINADVAERNTGGEWKIAPLLALRKCKNILDDRLAFFFVQTALGKQQRQRMEISEETAIVLGQKNGLE